MPSLSTYAVCLATAIVRVQCRVGGGVLVGLGVLATVWTPSHAR